MVRLIYISLLSRMYDQFSDTVYYTWDSAIVSLYPWYSAGRFLLLRYYSHSFQAEGSAYDLSWLELEMSAEQTTVDIRDNFAPLVISFDLWTSIIEYSWWLDSHAITPNVINGQTMIYVHSKTYTWIHVSLSFLAL